MKKRVGFALITAIICMLMFNVYINKADTIQNTEELQEDRITKVLENCWDKYNLSSYMIGKTDSTIWIGTEKIEHKDALLKYLKQHAKESDLKKYKVEIFEQNKEEN